MMSIYTFGRQFYNVKDMLLQNRDFFRGCVVKPREIIERKKIPESDYVYATLTVKTNDWKSCEDNCRKAQLLISKSWVDANFEIPTPKTDAELVYEDVEAPLLLSLDENEKFKDENGNVLEVEVRGERHKNKIFFKVQDVMTAFKMPSLDRVLFDVTSNYERNLHYKCFNRPDSGILSQSNKPTYTEMVSSIQSSKKSLYLTYKGLLRVLFTSRVGTAEKFQDWAEEILCTVQMGTLEQKEELGTSILNIHIDNYRAVFKKYSQHFPCIYLISLGKVADLRNDLGISLDVDDTLNVYKYGHTTDMERRLGEHKRDYGKYKSATIDLELFNYIDPKYTSEAEGEIREIFDSYGKSLTVDGRNELVALNPKELYRVKKDYTRTGKEYAGASEVLQTEILELKKEILELKHEIQRLNTLVETTKTISQLEIDKYKTLAETNAMISENIKTISQLELDKFKLKEDNYELQLKLKC